MKNNSFRKFFVTLFVAVLSVLALGACRLFVEDEYVFGKEQTEIVKIEIVDIGRRNTKEFEERALYPVEDIETFLEEFESLKCISTAHHAIENSTGVKFTYSDGSYEIVGADGGCVYDPKTGELSNNRLQCFSSDEFAALMEKYSLARYSGELAEYSFMHNTSEIIEIQLVDICYTYNCLVPIERKATYTVTDVEAFLSDFRKVECRMGGKPDLIREEKRIILVKYKNGEYEYIGAEGYLEFRHTYGIYMLGGTDCQCFDKEQFTALIEKYSPPTEQTAE